MDMNRDALIEAVDEKYMSRACDFLQAYFDANDERLMWGDLSLEEIMALFAAEQVRLTSSSSSSYNRNHEEEHIHQSKEH